MIKIILVLVIYLLPTILLSNELLNTYSYTQIKYQLNKIEKQNILKIDQIYIDTVNKIVGKKTAESNYYICEKDEKYYCFISYIFNLKVPNHVNIWPDTWKDNSSNYEFIGVEDIHLYGITYKVNIIIRTPIVNNELDHQSKEIFYYSNDKGLIAFTVPYTEDNIIINYYSAQESGVRLDLLKEKWNGENRTGDRTEQETE